VDERFAQVDQRCVEIQQVIVAEGERTRGHFDLAAEKIVGQRNCVIDRSAATEQRLVG
jgi:hypothetical protein